MERLTKEFYYTNEPTTWTQKVNNKLGELEDLMEQEGCKNVRDLKLKLEMLKQMQIAAAKTFAENKELKEKAKDNCRHVNQLLDEAYFQVDELKQQIQGLQEHLKNAIVPKFKVGQEVWLAYLKDQIQPVSCTITSIRYDSDHQYSKFHYDTINGLYCGLPESYLFATQAEAEQKLKELKGESK